MPKNRLGVNLDSLWTYGVFYIALLASLACVRKITKFNFAFVFAVSCLMSSSFIVIYYSSIHIYHHGINKDVVAINPEGMWSMVGFSIFFYEGIGVLMPIMQTSECPEKFDKILVLAMITVTVLFISLGLAGYLAFGNMAGVQAITMEMPYSDLLVQLMLFLMIWMVIFTYPIFIWPANITIESYTVDLIFKKKSSTESFWLKNVSRLAVCTLGAYCSIELQQVLAKFFGLIGAICCGPIALTLPSLCHLKLGLATTRNEKLEDICIIALSIVIMIFCILRTIEDS